jgi:hypothetical protein
MYLLECLCACVMYKVLCMQETAPEKKTGIDDLFHLVRVIDPAPTRVGDETITFSSGLTLICVLRVCNLLRKLCVYAGQ